MELETPRNFKVTPYARTSANRDYETMNSVDYDADWGVDSKFGVTPSLNLDLTYNTDFAQVEVDEQQINLTRFNLFFPEKRPFFLENAGYFSMGRPRSAEPPVQSGRQQAYNRSARNKVVSFKSLPSLPQESPGPSQ